MRNKDNMNKVKIQKNILRIMAFSIVLAFSICVPTVSAENDMLQENVLPQTEQAEEADFSIVIPEIEILSHEEDQQLYAELQDIRQRSISATLSLSAPSYFRAPYITNNSGLYPKEYSYNQALFNSIKAPAVWNFKTKTSNSIHIGIMDTGIQYANPCHEDLLSKVVGGVSSQWSWDHDFNGHGTMVAGVIGATGNNDVGGNGICWDSKLFSLKFKNGDTGSYDDLKNTLDALNDSSVKIINCSFGDIAAYPNYISESLGNFNGLLVCSAGNDGVNIDSQSFVPGGLTYNNIICVGALDANGNIADYEDWGSNYGAQNVDLFAPGYGYYTTMPVGDESYSFLNGTSSAAPLVAATAAMIWDINPDLTKEEVKNYILQNVDTVPALNGLCVTGGKLNMFKAIRAVCTATNPKRSYIGDFNGDGKEDILYVGRQDQKMKLTTFLGQAGGSILQAHTTVTDHSFTYGDPIYVGDVNHDGKSDVITHWVNNSNKRQLKVFTAKGDGYFYTGVNYNTNYDYDTVNHPSQADIGDVNWDGFADFIMQYKDSSGKRRTVVFCGTSQEINNVNCGTFQGQLVSASNRTYVQSDPIYFRDVDGDGCTDMVVHWVANGKRQLLTYTGNTTGYFFEGVNYSTTNTHNTTVYPCQMAMASITENPVSSNGKVKRGTDFVVCWKSSDSRRNFLVYRGTRSNDRATFLAGVNTKSNSVNYIASDPILYGNVNLEYNGSNLLKYEDAVVHWVAGTPKTHQFYVFKSLGNGQMEQAVITSTTGTYLSNFRKNDFVLLDVNGDGLKDAIYSWVGDSKLMNYNVCLANGNTCAFLQPVWYEMKQFPYHIYSQD